MCCYLIMNRRILVNVPNKSDNNNFDYSIISHAIVQYRNIQQLSCVFHWKYLNRYCKFLCNIDLESDLKTTNKQDLKQIIKHITLFGLDGVVFSNINKDNVDKINTLLLLFQKLPVPYNFKWEAYLDFSSSSPDNILLCCGNIKKLNQMAHVEAIIVCKETVEYLTDNDFRTCSLIVMHSQFDEFHQFIKDNKLGGVFLPHTDNDVDIDVVSETHKHLCHSILYLQNHIEYPSSQLHYMFLEHFYEDIVDIIKYYEY